MEKIEFLNTVFTERLLSVAGEIFKMVKDIIIEYQEEIDRAKQENVYVKKMLTTELLDKGQDGQTSEPQEQPITSETLDSNPSVIQVKVELSTMKQDCEPLNKPSTCTSSSAHQCFPVKPINEEKQEDCSRNNPGVAIKSEPWEHRVFISANSSSVEQFDRESENLGDGQTPDLSSQCQLSYDALQSQTVEGVSFCEYCGKPFSTRMQLKRHLIVHQKERPRPYRCDLCGKSYPYAQVLEVHRRTHTGERPYRCRFCGRGFNQNGHCKDHERIHTGEKPFSCPVCGKRFIQSSQVRKHVNYHHPSVKFP